MNHDYSHCLDYIQGVCPMSCFRAELALDLAEWQKQTGKSIIVSYAHFIGTEECARRRMKQAEVGRYDNKENELEVVVRPNANSGIEYPYCPVCNHRMTSARAAFMKHKQVYDYAYCETCGQRVVWT